MGTIVFLFVLAFMVVVSIIMLRGKKTVSGKKDYKVEWKGLISDLNTALSGAKNKNEFDEILNYFTPRTAKYMNDPDFVFEYNKTLKKWLPIK